MLDADFPGRHRSKMCSHGRSSVLPSRCCFELDAVVGQDRVDLVGNGLRRGGAGTRPAIIVVALSCSSTIGELAGPIDGHEEIELAFRGLHLGDVDVEEADRVAS